MWWVGAEGLEAWNLSGFFGKSDGKEIFLGKTIHHVLENIILCRFTFPHVSSCGSTIQSRTACRTRSLQDHPCICIYVYIYIYIYIQTYVTYHLVSTIMFGYHSDPPTFCSDAPFAQAAAARGKTWWRFAAWKRTPITASLPCAPGKM